MTPVSPTDLLSYHLLTFRKQILPLMDIPVIIIVLEWSLLPFLGNTLSWLMGTATTKDVNSIKNRVNQLTESQSIQQETLVQIISILNITRYTAQVNRHSINVIMDKVNETVHDVNNLYNLTTSLATSLRYHQLILHIRSILANLWDSLSYIRTVSMHTMDYLNAATTGTLSHHVLPIMDLKKMLSHIEETLPPTLHLPVLSEDTLHFYHYLCCPCSECQQTVLTPHRCAHSRLITTAFNLQNFTLGQPPWNFHHPLWHQFPISWYHTGWNSGSRNLTSSIQHLSGRQWTIL